MGRYVLRRLLWMPLVLFVLITLTFFLIRAAPGGPFSSERQVPKEVEANLEAKYGMNSHPVVQYGRYLGGLVQGDLGPSFKYKDRSVNDILGAGIGKTALLGGVATVLALAIGLTAGVIGAVRRNSVFDYASMSVATFGMSVPNFVTGPVLVLLFALVWKVLPVSETTEGESMAIVFDCVLDGGYFLMPDGSLAAGKKVFDRFQLFTRAESLGGVESLVCHPSSMTHASVPREVRLAQGFADGLLRLSVGIEDLVDLRADLDQSLQDV